MSVDQLPTRPAKPAAGGTKLVQYDQYIDQQVESTRRVVKLVDLATSLVVLVAGVLAYLLVVAVAEHWIVPGGFPFAVRVVLFAILVCGVGYYAVRRIWPLVIGKINPVYAAQAIEQTGPSLKNSLVNLLLFRQKRAGISDAVYKTLEEQAAQRLSRVPVDAAVDRTTLIRFGYVLIAIVAVAGLYKVFSPKDPVISAKRVLMPWANIVPASRVTIDAIEPGEVTVSRGENLVVSAEVRGAGDDDAVMLKYTTRDGQAVDKRVNMKLSSDGMRYEGRLPKGDGQSADAGLSESLTYRIEAGDARSLDYAVTVVPSPSILVERIDYDYPEYTGFVDRTVEGLGDIRAIEGTRVTIHARANGAIAEAHVDFDADGRRELSMTAREGNANTSFTLELRDDRTTPKHASYVLRFMNAERRANINPVKHSIGVDPDYAPEASIVAPREEVLDVRLDETVAIEVEARDPDFAVADVRLHGDVSGRSVVDERLLTTGPKKRFTSRYQFTPKHHNLRAGDTVQYWIAASDNKSPSPNTTLTKKQVLRIVSPDPAQQPPPDRIAQRDRQQRQQPGGRQGEQGEQQGQQGEQQSQDGAGGGKQQGEQQQGAKGNEQQQGEQQGQGSEGGANSDQQNSRDAQRDQQQQGEAQQEQGGEQQQSEQSDQQSGESQGGESQAGDENSGQQMDGQSGKQQQPGQQGGQSEGQGQSGERQQGGSQQQGGAKQQDGSNSNNKQTGAGAAGGEPSNGAQPDGARPDASQGKSSTNDGQSKGSQQPSDAESSPVSSEGDDDAEAFERIQKHLQRDGQIKDDPSASEQNQEQGQQKGETGKQGDAKQSAAQSDTEGKAQQEQQGRAEQQGEVQQSEKAQQTSGEQQQKDQGAEQQPGAEKTGDQSSDAKSAQKQTGEKGDESRSQGGEQANTKGEPGAGQEKESQGAPNSQPNMKPGEKREQQGSQGEQTNEQEPPAGARGKKESDSSGEEGGDRAGGGEEGGGQRAPREGTGSAGQNQSADEGGGASDEKGQGVDSSSPGQDSASDNQKGTPGGETTGRGRKVKPGEGDKPGGTEPGEKPSGEQQQDAEPGKQADDTGSNRGAPTGQGGNHGSEGTPAPRDGGTVPEGDKANLDYARERTDLVLEKLSDQLKRKRVDEKMLKQLGWTKEDLQKFIARWEARKRAAEQNDAAGEAAQRELDDALRSLGLRRGPMQQNRVQDDEMRDLKEGYRGPVPLEYQERLRAYNQGVSRAREDGE